MYSNQKKDSWPISRVLYPLKTKRVKGVCHLSEPNVTIVALAVYPLAKASSSHSASLHDLATSKTHSTDVTTSLVGSYPTFSPLPAGWQAVIFFYVTLPSRTASC